MYSYQNLTPHSLRAYICVCVVVSTDVSDHLFTADFGYTDVRELVCVQRCTYGNAHIHKTKEKRLKVKKEEEEGQAETECVRSVCRGVEDRKESALRIIIECPTARF